MGRLLIVSNRLPVTITRREGGFRIAASVGGLATGLASLHAGRDSLWYGWPGVSIAPTESEELKTLSAELKRRQCRPVHLSRTDIDDYYHGFSNGAIWPEFHYSPGRSSYRDREWRAYQRVNRQFADAVVRAIREGDQVWVHDYHLMLLPRLIRQQRAQAVIGFFLHIPFPSSELFRTMPWRHDLLRGMIGADLIGFHTYDYCRHFLSSVRRVLGLENTGARLRVEDRVVAVDAFPMGIDYDRFDQAARDPGTAKLTTRSRRPVGDRRTILSVDRLDYSKGIPERLVAYETFLETHPEYRDRVSLIQLVVPSRTRVSEYRNIKEQVDELIGRINGRFGALDWTPVVYLYRSVPFQQLVALYRGADIALVTPLRDGMNLVAKEYLAAQTDGRGVLILSETAGAADELGEALLVNPNHREEVVGALVQALEMPEEEQVRRNQAMRQRLARYTVQAWGDDFLARLSRSVEDRRQLAERRLLGRPRRQLVEEYLAAKRSLILLDYDGTLVPFADRPELAKPDPRLIRLLRRLNSDRGTTVVVISGRPRAVLEDWFSTVAVDLVAEHGACHRLDGGGWRMAVPLRREWKAFVRPLLERYVDRTPGALLEEKEYSLVWHYRRVPPELADLRVGELKSALADLTGEQEVLIQDGNKVIEVQAAGTSKGDAVTRWLARARPDFVLAIGDDTTDEAMFAALPRTAWTVKVGHVASNARFALDSPRQVRSLLRLLAG